MRANLADLIAFLEPLEKADHYEPASIVYCR